MNAGAPNIKEKEFTGDYIQLLNQKGCKMELKHKLLEHPFYQAWMNGEISEVQLSKYSRSYMDFIERIPLYWQNILDGFGIKDTTGKEIVEEEKQHIALWKQWSSQLEKAEPFPMMTTVLNEFEKMNPSELLGALHAFEIQQPGVAVTKKEGLLQHYGFTTETTAYFDEHMNEQKHISYGEMLARNFADKNDFANGFERGSKLIYESLNLFLN
jgi:pyrroloquinoline quinone (PQQ) biosynthesis protein C